MIAAIGKVPPLLRTLVWLNLAVAAVELVVASGSFYRGAQREALGHFADVVVTVLIVIGILRRYALVRALCLALCYLAVTLKSFAVLIDLQQRSPMWAPDIVLAAVFGFMIWALSAPQSKAHFSRV